MWFLCVLKNKGITLWSFSIDPVKYVFEPQSVTLIIRRQGRLDKQGRVHYRTLDGSASYLEGDYTQIQPQELLFDIGQQDRVITVIVLDDDTPEGNETFSVQLFDVGGKWMGLFFYLVWLCFNITLVLGLYRIGD